MTIKEFLRDIKRKNSSIKVIEAQISSLRDIAEYKTPVPDPIGGGHGTPDPHSRESLVAKLVDMTIDLDRMKMEYLDDIDKATKMILSLSDDKTILVFHKRYLQFRTWEYIAEDMDISTMWVHKLHKRGLIELSNKYPSFLD